MGIASLHTILRGLGRRHFLPSSSQIGAVSNIARWIVAHERDVTHQIGPFIAVVLCVRRLEPRYSLRAPLPDLAMEHARAIDQA